MSDAEDLDRLGALLSGATPDPGPEAVARARTLALAAFDAQAAAADARPRKDGSQRAARTFGGWTMPTLTLRRGLYGGASLAVIALAVLIVQDPAILDPRPEPVVTEKEEASQAADEAAPVAPPPPAPRAVVPRVADREPQPTVRVRRATDSAEALPSPGLLAQTAPVPSALPPVERAPRIAREPGRDRFEGKPANPLKVTAEEPVSTFSIDVDTASYSWVRRSLQESRMPEPGEVRIEELVNYFPYAYPAPAGRETPFATAVTVMPTPWNEGTKLLHIGIRGYDIAPGERPDANLVFLIDTSGSMEAPDRLPLLLDAFRLLLDELRPTDQVAIVAYAGSAGVVLEPTAASDRATILAALGRLSAGGGTAGGTGILAAYALAERMKVEGEATRILLATDGDFNVGVSDPEALTRLVEEKRKSGVFLSVLGFGEGNYNDALMQRLAQNGNGQAAYIDSLSEARKVLAEGVAGALFTIAKDVKVQVEFNPATVAEYRLIGYETRALAREDFANDRVDAGEIGAGHTVTALYEITPVGSTARLTDDLRYGTQTAPTSAEYGFLKLRYKLPEGTESALIARPVTRADEGTNPEAAFAAAVAGFGELLKGSKYIGTWGWDDALALARANTGEDPFGYRAGFLDLVRTAATLAQLRRP